MAQKIELELVNAEVQYKGTFSPPAVELGATEKQVILIKALCVAFGLRFKDVIINAQNMTAGLMYFRKFFPERGIFEAFIGVDEFSTYYSNPVSAGVTWEPTLKILESLTRTTEITFALQVLTLNLHVASPMLSGNEIISRMNTFQLPGTEVKSKGISFNLAGPYEGSNLYLALAESYIVKDGLYLLVQYTFERAVPDYRGLFDAVKAHLIPLVEKLDLQVRYVE